MNYKTVFMFIGISNIFICSQKVIFWILPVYCPILVNNLSTYSLLSNSGYQGYQPTTFYFVLSHSMHYKTVLMCIGFFNIFIYYQKVIFWITLYYVSNILHSSIWTHIKIRDIHNCRKHICIHVVYNNLVKEI